MNVLSVFVHLIINNPQAQHHIFVSCLSLFVVYLKFIENVRFSERRQ